jgi:hypothetical protein
MKIQVSHNASGNEWFVVRPMPGEEVIAGPTNEMSVKSLKDAGRSVYELDVEFWENKEHV